MFLQIERAVRDGFDVRGMFYWTLIDNFVSTLRSFMECKTQHICIPEFRQDVLHNIVQQMLLGVNLLLQNKNAVLLLSLLLQQLYTC